MHKARPLGMFAFTVIWAGQVVSLLGSAMSWFAFTIWAWQTTGEATALALVSFFSFGPTLLFSPLAGVLVDRWNRKIVMMLSDLATGLCTVVILALYLGGQLEIWHIYAVAVVAGSFQAFQYPAYSAAVTMMLPQEHYARAQGMLGLATSVAGILGPLLGAVLLGSIGFANIMFLDITTFVFAIGVLLLVHIPQPAKEEVAQRGQGALWRESLYGFRYIVRRPGLLGLQLVVAAGGFLDAVGYTLMAPMILARTAGNNVAFGTVESAGAIGATLGGILLVAWGGPRRRIHGVLAAWALASLLGWLFLGLGATLVIWAAASLLSSFLTPVINASEQALWQAKVAPGVQGRVFATKHLLSEAGTPIGMLLAGPLADRVFEPAMMPGGSLAAAFGGLVGTGAGAGMALILVIVGILGIVVPLSGYAFPAIRNVEVLLPDHCPESASSVGVPA
jgi:DHA3 family macrolide efflux protein-like MFS transporter